eukprot:205175-Hanusia_phi.AAC.1
MSPVLLLLALTTAGAMQRAGVRGGEDFCSSDPSQLSCSSTSSRMDSHCSFIGGRIAGVCPSTFRVMVLAADDGSRGMQRAQEALRSFNGSDVSIFTMPVIHHRDARRLERQGIRPSDLVKDSWIDDDYFDIHLTKSVLYRKALEDAQNYENSFFLFVDLDAAEVLLLRGFVSMVEEVIASVSSFIDIITLDTSGDLSIRRNLVEQSDMHAVLHRREACVKILESISSKHCVHPSMLLRNLVRGRKIKMLAAQRGSLDVKTGRYNIRFSPFGSKQHEQAGETFLLDTSVSSAYVLNISSISAQARCFLLSRSLWDCEEGDQSFASCPAMMQSGMLVLFPITRNRRLLDSHEHIFCGDKSCKKTSTCPDRLSTFQMQAFEPDHVCWGRTVCNMSVVVSPRHVNGYLQSDIISLTLEKFPSPRSVTVCFLIDDSVRLRVRPSMLVDSTVIFLSQLDRHDDVAQGDRLLQRQELIREAWKMSVTKGAVFEFVVFCDAKSVEDDSCDKFT